MKLVTFSDLSQERAGAIIDGEVLDLMAAAETLGFSNWRYGSVAGILAGGSEAMGMAREIIDAAAGSKDILRDKGLLRQREQTQIIAPIPRPSLIMMAGSNYSKHSEEMGGSTALKEPHGFIKASGCVIGTGSPIVLPPAAPDMVDYEGELAVIFGKTAYNVQESEAMDYVAGYMCCNDVSARDWISEFDAWREDPTISYEAFSDPGTKNMRYKSFPTFMPCGPALVTADEVGDPHNLKLLTTVNGEIRQDTTTDMTFRIPKLIAYWSRIFEFKPGDILSTGSPGGVGVAMNPPVFLKEGDVVTIEIEKLGSITNAVIAFDNNR